MLTKPATIVVGTLLVCGSFTSSGYALTEALSPTVISVSATTSSTVCLVETRAPRLDPVTGQFVDCMGEPISGMNGSLYNSSTLPQFVPNHSTPTITPPTAEEIKQDKIRQAELQKQMEDVNKILESDSGKLKKIELNF